MTLSISLLDFPTIDLEKLKQLERALKLNTDLGIFAEQIDCNFTSDFTDGKLDGENNFEPIAYQWENLEYRQGYLIGMAKRIGIEYTLIRGVNKSKVIVVN
ncbi:MAG: hypothetical protein AAGE96_23560 [Cyanobacteria bacterium P01_G01_bin.19]